MRIIQIQPADPKIRKMVDEADELDYRNMAKLIASVMVKKVVNGIRVGEAEKNEKSIIYKSIINNSNKRADESKRIFK